MIAAMLLFCWLVVPATGETDTKVHEMSSLDFKDGAQYTGSETNLYIVAVNEYVPSKLSWDPLLNCFVHSGGGVNPYNVIPDSAFEGSKITSVVLADLSNYYMGADTLYYTWWKTIGDYAFRNCRQLRSVTIPRSVSQIGTGVFDGCDLNLLTVTVNPDSTAEQYCIDHGVRYEYAEIRGRGSGFSFAYREQKDGTAALTEYTVDTGTLNLTSRRPPYPELTQFYALDRRPVAKICEGAFTGIEYYESLILQDNVTEIENRAFVNWPSLKKIYIPASVKKIGLHAFDAVGSDKLVVKVEAGSYAETYCRSRGLSCSVWSEEDQFWYYTGDDGTAYVIRYNGSQKEITVPREIEGHPVTSVGKVGRNSSDVLQNYEFTGNEQVEKIILPDTVTTIGRLSGLDHLKEIVIPRSVTVIGPYAFLGCTALTDVIYSGTREDWNRISIDAGNNPLMLVSFTFR